MSCHYDIMLSLQWLMKINLKKNASLEKKVEKGGKRFFDESLCSVPLFFKKEKAFGFDKKEKNEGDTNNNPLCSIVIVIKKQMLFRQKELPPQLKERLKEYVYDVIGHLFKVYKELPCGFPEYIYQEALGIVFTENRVPFKKEYIFHPLFRGKPLMSYFKMDFMLDEVKEILS